MEDIFNWFRESRTTVGILGVILLFWLSYNTVIIILKNYELAQQIAQLEDEISLLELENQNFKFQINYYQTDAFLDLEARDKLSKVGSGESIVVLPDDRYDNLELGSTTNGNVESQIKLNLDEWKKFLFGADS